MKKIFLLFFISFVHLKSSEAEKTFDKRLCSSDIKIVHEAIIEGANVNAKNKFGDTALIIAAFSNRIDTAKLLIDSGADISTHNQDGYSALMCAIMKNCTELVKLLIDSGADLHGDIEVIKDRMEHLKKLELEFIKSAQEGDIKTLQSLIEQKININAQDENGFTALIRAVQAFIWFTQPYSQQIKDELKRKLDIVKILLAKKADFTIKDNVMHYTALKWAQESGNTQAEKLLKNAGATE